MLRLRQMCIYPAVVLKRNFVLSTSQEKETIAMLVDTSDTSHAALLSHIEQLEFLTVSEVADQLRLSKSTVYNLINKGVLPSARFGKAVRINRVHLDQYIRTSYHFQQDTTG